MASVEREDPPAGKPEVWGLGYFHAYTYRSFDGVSGKRDEIMGNPANVTTKFVANPCWCL
jgi:hypothetical protein